MSHSVQQPTFKLLRPPSTLSPPSFLPNFSHSRPSRRHRRSVPLPPSPLLSTFSPAGQKGYGLKPSDLLERQTLDMERKLSTLKNRMTVEKDSVKGLVQKKEETGSYWRSGNKSLGGSLN